MKLLEVFKSPENIQLDKKTLVILRWIAIVGQLITINIVYFILNCKNTLVKTPKRIIRQQ